MSIGHWEGDTLVTDVIGFNDRTWLDQDGHPHGEALHVIEKFTRLNELSMRYEVTIDDPEMYDQAVDHQLSDSVRPRRGTVRVHLPGKQRGRPASGRQVNYFFRRNEHESYLVMPSRWLRLRAGIRGAARGAGQGSGRDAQEQRSEARGEQEGGVRLLPRGAARIPPG